MDDFTTRHLESWLDSYCLDDDEKDRCRSIITAAVNADPSLLNLDWRTILEANQNG